MKNVSIYSAIVVCSALALAGCNKKTALTTPVIATPQISDSTLNPVEALSPAERLSTSYLNSDGKRLDATGTYYLDDEGNILGKVSIQSQSMLPELSAEQQLAEYSTIYFDFDSSQLSNENQSILNMHAGYLTNKPAAHVVIEGHTDQRGTREYNLALGDRRAKQVQNYLQFAGIKESQISTLSYGKEKLVDPGDSEEAHQNNRRAELKYPVGTP